MTESFSPTVTDVAMLFDVSTRRIIDLAPAVVTGVGHTLPDDTTAECAIGICEWYSTPQIGLRVTFADTAGVFDTREVVIVGSPVVGDVEFWTDGSGGWPRQQVVGDAVADELVHMLELFALESALTLKDD